MYPPASHLQAESLLTAPVTLLLTTALMIIKLATVPMAAEPIVNESLQARAEHSTSLR